MRNPIAQRPSPISLLKRALEMWPYVLIAISVVGLAYLALNHT